MSLNDDLSSVIADNLLASGRVGISMSNYRLVINCKQQILVLLVLSVFPLTPVLSRSLELAI